MSKLPTYILLKKYQHGLPLLLHRIVNNISNHYANDEWSPIYIAEIVGFTVKIGCGICRKCHFYKVRKLSNLEVKNPSTIELSEQTKWFTQQ